MTVKAQVETHAFDADVGQLMDIVTNALYTDRQIFVRELVSNASDAAEKLRQLALSDEALLEDQPQLEIRVAFDKQANTVTFTDNGIGMSREEVIKHLGTIANSGTKQFLQGLTGDAKKDAGLIGQFGVGFYSAFVVASKVVVKSRRAGTQAEQGVSWSSSGKGDYEVQNVERQARGTEITLYLKDDAKEFCDYWHLKNTITKYSNHVQWPIMMQKETLDKDGKATGEYEDEQVNEATALWVLPKQDVTDEQYKKFYTSVSHHDYQDPLAWSHNRVEGKLEYISLLYIPQKAPFDLFYREQQRGLKLYIQRVFIMDDAEQLLPMYLRFVRGVVDSNDLPLNVSRELLQSNKTIESIRSGCTKRVLSMLEAMAKKDTEDYDTFWKTFGMVLKEGVAEDHANKDRIAKLLRFASTHEDTPDQQVSLEDYVGRMAKKQDTIYYLVAESHAAAASSPHLEIFKKKGIEVLLLTDRVDEWLTAHLTEFDGKKLQSVAKGDLGDFGKEEEVEDEKDFESKKKSYESIINQMKDVLKDQVEDVRLTTRLVDSPACLVSAEDQMSSHLQRMMREAGQDVPESKPTLEVNPEHPILAKLKDEADDAKFSELSNIVFDQAVLADGGKIKDPMAYLKRVNAFLVEAL